MSEKGKIGRVLKLVLALCVVTVVLAGCGTFPMNEHQSWGNKVWRMGVNTPHLHVTYIAAAADRGLPKSMVHRRWAEVFMQTPGIFDGELMWAEVLVPDQIPALHKNDIIDVYLVDPPDLRWHGHGRHWNHVVKLVCRANDAPCKAQLLKEYGRYTGVSLNPAPTHPVFTYNDRTSY